MRWLVAVAAWVIGASASAQQCAPPTSATLCEMLDAIGEHLVTCERDPQTGLLAPGGVYASADDTCDDKLGIDAAATRARGRGTVVLPPGSLDAAQASRPYLVSGPVWIQGVSMRGQRSGVGHQGTRIAVMPNAELAPLSSDCVTVPAPALPGPYGQCSGGAVLRASDGTVRIEQITIVAGPHPATGGVGVGIAAFGIYLYKAHGAVLEDVAVRGASQSGIVTEYSMVQRWQNVTVQYNGRGATLFGANGTSIIGANAANNSGDGLVIAGRTSEPSPATSEVSVWGTVTEANGGHGLWLNRVYGTSSIIGVRAEGNAGDGIRLEQTDNAAIRDARVIVGPLYQHPTVPGESLFHGVSLVSCRACVVERVATNGSHGRQNVWVEGAAPFTRVSDVVYWGSAAAGPLEYAGASSWVRVAWHDPVSGVTWYSRPARRDVWADSPPPSGPAGWRAGDVVRSVSPAPGQPTGWGCRSTPLYGSTCGAWSALPRAEAQ